MEEPYAFAKSQKLYLVVKRCFDIFFSAILIVIALIPMGIIAIVTALTSNGPALFRQKRLGKGKVPFTMLKFRSMRTDAPEIGQELVTPDITKKYVTGWGMFMRKTSLDELPQLFLIFIGKMSFIGPRPSLLPENDAALCKARDSYQPSCYLVRPGLSGLAQVKLHRDFDPNHKAELDSEYVRTISLWTDIKIFFWSFAVIINSGTRTHK